LQITGCEQCEQAAEDVGWVEVLRGPPIADYGLRTMRGRRGGLEQITPGQVTWARCAESSGFPGGRNKVARAMVRLSNTIRARCALRMPKGRASTSLRSSQLVGLGVPRPTLRPLRPFGWGKMPQPRLPFPVPCSPFPVPPLHVPNSGRRLASCNCRRCTMLLCIWLTRLSLRSSVAPISFMVSSS